MTYHSLTHSGDSCCRALTMARQRRLSCMLFSTRIYDLYLYLIGCVCIPSSSIDEKIAHCCFFSNEIKIEKTKQNKQTNKQTKNKNKKNCIAHSSFLDILLETHLISFGLIRRNYSAAKYIQYYVFL